MTIMKPATSTTTMKLMKTRHDYLRKLTEAKYSVALVALELTI